MSISFLKLDINIFNDTKIKLIRQMPEGDTMLIAWLGILCLAMKSGTPGVLEVGDGIPFTPKLLSIELGIKESTMILALETFEKFKMIDLFENGEIYISKFEKHQELQRIRLAKQKTAERVRKHREKLKKGQLLVCNENVTRYGSVTKHESNASDLDLDKDLDKDLDIYKEMLQHWNDKKIVVHKNLSSSMKKSIDKCLKDYKKEEIFKSIDNYSEVYRGEKYYFNHRWILEDFLSRGLKKFLDEVEPLTNYIKFEDNNSKTFNEKMEDFDYTDQIETKG